MARGTGVWTPSGQGCKITVTNPLKDLVAKVNNMRGKDNFNRHDNSKTEENANSGNNHISKTTSDSPSAG